MRKSLIILCILVMAFFLLTATAQEDFSKIGLRSRAAGLQAVYNYLQSQGQTGLIKGWWRFNEVSGNLIDYSGNNNNLTPSGSPIYRQADYLGLARAITFNGIDAYFSIAHASQTGLDLGLKDAIILAIFKANDKTDNRYLLGKEESPKYNFRINSITGYLQSYIQDDAENSKTIIGSTDVTDNLYHLGEIRLDKSAYGQIYLDGNTNGSAIDITIVGNLDNVGDFYTGARIGSSAFFLGSISETMMLVGNPTLPANILSDAFALFAYNQALGYPLKLPRKIKQ